MSTGPLPADRSSGLAGSAPAIMMPAPSSLEWFSVIRLSWILPFGLSPYTLTPAPYSSEKLPQMSLSATS